MLHKRESREDNDYQEEQGHVYFGPPDNDAAYVQRSQRCPHVAHGHRSHNFEEELVKAQYELQCNGAEHQVAERQCIDEKLHAHIQQDQ